MLTSKEYEIYGRYKKGAIVRSQDEYILESASRIGFVTEGLHECEDGEIVSTAKLTPIAKRIYKREWLEREHPVLNFLYHLLFV